jgi:hypothetical protein
MGWEDLKEILPEELEESAVKYQALKRRRGVHNAEDLLHLGMGYCVLDKSLKDLGSWALGQRIANISAPALYERLCEMNVWMGRLLVQVLEQHRLRLPQERAVNIEIRDATVISRPGSQGTDWRIHLNLDLGAMCIRGVELTDAKGGESLVRFAGEADRIVLADRIHANRNGLRSLLQAGSYFAIRMTWQNLPLEDEQQQPWSLIDWLQTAFADPCTVFQEHSAILRTGQQGDALRVCAVRLPKEAAELAVQRARKQAQKNGHTPDARTLYAAQFVLVITNLPVQTWSTQQILDLYRLRWQVELFFKRLKSILFLDHLRARKTNLAQTYLLGKLLAACWLDRLTHRFVQLLPAGFSTRERPLSYWSLVSLLWEQFQILIRGPLYLNRIGDLLPKLQRFLCAAPRKRPQQLAAFLLPLEPASLPDHAPISQTLS